VGGVEAEEKGAGAKGGTDGGPDGGVQEDGRQRSRGRCRWRGRHGLEDRLGKRKKEVKRNRKEERKKEKKKEKNGEIEKMKIRDNLRKGGKFRNTEFNRGSNFKKVPTENKHKPVQKDSPLLYCLLSHMTLPLHPITTHQLLFFHPFLSFLSFAFLSLLLSFILHCRSFRITKAHLFYYKPNGSANNMVPRFRVPAPRHGDPHCLRMHHHR
jgi:hypothetical protein